MTNLWDQLNISFQTPIRDPLWGTILLPDEFKGLLSHFEFIKLSRIMQLGPTHLVYPAATHTRLAHSYGVYLMAGRQLKALIPTAKTDLISAEGARSFLVAALCHDIGHFPYTHSLKELPLEEHEALTAKIVLGSLADAVQQAGADPSQVAAIIDPLLPLPSEETALYRQLLSGVLDPDKLDYLNRDAWACGVPYGIQDTEFILRHIALDGAGRLGVDDRGVMGVESILFSKYQMYRAVYWHKAVRSATCMVKKAVMTALQNGSLLAAELYGLDDAGFYRLMAASHRDPQGLIRDVFNGQLLTCCYEAPYDKANSVQQRAARLANRLELEQELTEALKSPSRVVIDLPEPLSFESSIPVIGSGRDFADFNTVFRPAVVHDFTNSLRVLRVFSDLPAETAAPVIAEVLGHSRRFDHRHKH